MGNVAFTSLQKTEVEWHQGFNPVTKHNMKQQFKVLTIGLTLLVLTTTTHAELIQNGSFENPSITVGVTLTTLPGWFVSANVDILPNNYWRAFDGNQSLDLSGDSATGTYIQQMFPTVIGQSYLLSFHYGNNADDAWALGRASIFGDTTLLSQDLYHSGSTSQNMNYTFFQNEFIADASTTTLRFTHLDTPTFGRGLALDAVSVTPVPEPAPMLLLALGGAACVVWRKRHLA